jgi:hypothetical protein
MDSKVQREEGTSRPSERQIRFEGDIADDDRSAIFQAASGTTKLWRRLSLDKLIDLLSTSELFFRSSCDLREDRPFEGYLTTVAFDGLLEWLEQR